MKKVTTNITFSQILFILFTFCFASLIFFYLGAKFGPQILEISLASTQASEPILPDEQLAMEIQELLKSKKHDFVFHDALENKGSVQQVSKTVESKTNKPQDQISGTMEALEAVKQHQLDKIELEKQATKVALASKSTNSNTLQNKPQEIKQEPPKKTTTPPVVKEVAKIQPKPEPKPVSAATTKITPKPVEIKKVNFLTVKTAEPQVVDHVSKTSDDIDSQPAQNIDAKASSGAARYRLQLGSYSDPKKAQSALQMWQKRGYSASIVKTTIPGKGNWYRIRLGGYSDASEATVAQRNIMKKYRQSVSVVNIN